MYTQCPDCLSLYEVDAATLAQSHGSVGCGECGTTFDALSALAEELPEDTSAGLAPHASSPAPPILMVPVSLDLSAPPTALDTATTATAAAGEDDPEAREDADAAAVADRDPEISTHAQADATTPNEPPPLPSFARHMRHRQPPPRRTWRWVFACVLLTLCLGAQLVWAERKPMTADATTRPWLAGACSLLGCRLPAVRAPAKLQLLSRDVRPHPSVPGALLISATVRNDASFRQPYPVVSITLSDLDQNRIAMRRFRPTEYLADAKTRAAGLAPGATAALMFEVKDPGRNAVAFRFRFE